MVDIWRAQHPEIKDNTFYSPVHGTYSRLNYIMVEHRLLELVGKTSIEIMSLSDHAPVKLKLTGNQENRSTWRLNIDLIQEKEVEDKIKREIEQYFHLNETPEIAVATIWEAHKAYIWGILISIGARKKKKADLDVQYALVLKREAKRFNGTGNKISLK